MGWAFAAVYVVAFAWAYVDYWNHRGTWMADLWLDVLAIPYVLLGRALTLTPTFELHGFQPLGLLPALVFCTFLAYCLGAGLQRAVVSVRRRVARRARRDESD